MSTEDTEMQTVLIVDDEVGFLHSIEAGLAGYRDRFQVRTASNGLAALQILDAEKVDLLVTDLRMPEMDGFALLAHLAGSHPFLPAIVLTAFATPEIEESVNATGTARLLEKPVELERLAEAILEGLQRESKEGALAGFSLSNFLQLLSLEKKTCLLNVKNDRLDGYIYLEQGEISAALCGQEKGEEALYRLLAGDNLKIIFLKLPSKKIAKVIDKPLISLLMEAMRRIDENLSERHRQTEVEAPASAAPETVIEHPQPKGEAMSNLDETLNKLRDIEGFMAVGVFTPNGEMAAQVTAANLKLAEIGSLANDVLLKAQKATDVMNVGRGQLVHIESPKAHIIARCLNEADDFSQTQAGKAHIHMIFLLSHDANLAMAKIKLESVIHQVAESFR